MSPGKGSFRAWARGAERKNGSTQNKHNITAILNLNLNTPEKNQALPGREGPEN